MFKAKRFLAVLLSAAMLIGVGVVGVGARGLTDEERAAIASAVPITSGVTQTINNPVNEKVYCFSFTPGETGYYVLRGARLADSSYVTLRVFDENSNEATENYNYPEYTADGLARYWEVGLYWSLDQDDVRWTEGCLKLLAGQRYYLFASTADGSSSLSIDLRKATSEDLREWDFRRYYDQKYVSFKEPYDLTAKRCELFAANPDYYIPHLYMNGLLLIGFPALCGMDDNGVWGAKVNMDFWASDNVDFAAIGADCMNTVFPPGRKLDDLIFAYDELLAEWKAKGTVLGLYDELIASCEQLILPYLSPLGKTVYSGLIASFIVTETGMKFADSFKILSNRELFCQLAGQYIHIEGIETLPLSQRDNFYQMVLGRIYSYYYNLNILGEELDYGGAKLEIIFRTAQDFYDFMLAYLNAVRAESAVNYAVIAPNADLLLFYLAKCAGGTIQPPTTYTFTRTAGAGGTVSGTASGSYTQDTAINVTATANSGYHFKNWTVNGATITGGNTANPATFNMPAGAVTLTANFETDGTPGTVEKAALNGKITEAEGKVNDAKYTAASRAALKTAINNAKAVRDNASATQAQVDTAVEALTNAINALETASDYIRLWGKQTTWKKTFINWILLIVCFGWIWMAF